MDRENLQGDVEEGDSMIWYIAVCLLIAVALLSWAWRYRLGKKSRKAKQEFVAKIPFATLFERDPLCHVLNMAYYQAIDGKGKERHAEDKPFQDQIWSVITKTVGLGFPLGQAFKKWDEAQRMAKDAAVKEILGAIVYLAMAVIALLEADEAQK